MYWYLKRQKEESVRPLEDHTLLGFWLAFVTLKYFLRPSFSLSNSWTCTSFFNASAFTTLMYKWPSEKMCLKQIKSSIWFISNQFLRKRCRNISCQLNYQEIHLSLCFSYLEIAFIMVPDNKKVISAKSKCICNIPKSN